MFDYNSEIWTKHTAVEHAQDMLTDINTTLTTLGYTSVNLLKPDFTNAIWIMLLAQGNLRADYDNVLYEAQNSLDPALCADDQFLNLLPMAGTELTIGDYTTVEVTITASSVGDVVIPASSEMPFTNDIKFITPATIITIPSETALAFTVVANVRGAITVLANQLIVFTNTVANISTITSAQSIEGTADETITAARERVILGKTFDGNLDGLQIKLLALQGVTSAKVYFNPDPTDPLVLPGGIDIDPRTLQVYVVGTSTSIGETIFKTLMLKTQGGETQTYTTLSGQAFAIKFDYATSVPSYVNVYIPLGVVLSSAVQLEIKNMIAALSFDIGEAVTSARIDQLFIGFTPAEIVGSEISSNGVNYYREIIIDGNKYATIPVANITIINMT
jgi:hypothetical protein